MSNITSKLAYTITAELDPLKADDLASRLPEMNAERDVAALSKYYETYLMRGDKLLEQGCGAAEAAAALRDIDFVAASLVRHGAREYAQHERAQITLQELGRFALTVPRGTVFTYAASNPVGERERTFTGTAEERIFIDSVRQGIYALDDCVAALSEAVKGDVKHLLDAQKYMSQLVSSIVAVKQHITPEFFTSEMRPYFDELTIKGRTYAGAGGAQMQVVAVDCMLWGLDCSDGVYQAYYEDNARYLTAGHRKLLYDFAAATGGRSIVTLIEQGELAPEAVPATYNLLMTLRKFRYPHRKVARDNFALRSKDAEGSGRYTPNILDHLIELQEQAMVRLGEHDGNVH